MSFVIAYMTTSNLEEAEKIGTHLVQKKLAACVNYWPHMHSIYFWQGKLEKSEEVVLIAKTKKSLKEKFIKEVKKQHSYDIPCVVFLPLKGGSKEYLKWLKNSFVS